MKSNLSKSKSEIRYGDAFKLGVVREEQDDLVRLKLRMRRVEEVLGTTQVDLALAREYPELACVRAGITDMDGFKKKRLGRRASGGSRG